MIDAPPIHDARFTLAHVPSARASFADDVRAGLTASPKFLLPQYFYDALGSALFAAICELPEYYVTRAESEILSTRAGEIVQSFGAPIRFVELGSGNAVKTRLLIDAALQQQQQLTYAPLDIDPSVLTASATDLLRFFPNLRVDAVAGDFRDIGRAFAALPHEDARTVVLFLGSTIGNLDGDSAASLLRDVRAALPPNDALFLGVDLVKPKAVLEPAYDDPLGVTAAFNLNLLGRINRELGGHFELAQFAHRAFFNEEASRVEMHLVSRASQRVAIDALAIEIDFAEGESIHTENSHKYDATMIERLAERGGFSVERTWRDSRGWFADVLLRA